MPKGGDRRPLHPPEGRDLLYARWVFEALWENKSPTGLRFHEEREHLYQHWARLLRGIIAYKNGGSFFAGLEHTNKALDDLEMDHPFQNQFYPKPRELTSEERACCERRTAVADAAMHDLWLNLGRPFQPSDWDGTQEPWKTWEDVSSFLGKWGNEPAYNANSHCKTKRWVRRRMVVKYRQEVAAFCERWRLSAWWATPAIIQEQFTRAEFPDWDQTLTPLSYYVFDPGMPVSFFFMVKLPGRTDEQYETDKARSLNLRETTILKAAGGPVPVIRQHFSREERSGWEKAVDSSCIVVEVDGHPYLSQSASTGLKVTPTDYLLAQCADRLAQPLTNRERLSIKGQVDAQVSEYRSQLEALGWDAAGDGDRERVAGWVAAILLDPSTTWEQLSPIGDLRTGKNRYKDWQAVRRACLGFAEQANLTLPARPRGRRPGSKTRSPSIR